MSVITPETIEDQPLPQTVAWGTLADQPTSLKDISIDDATTLANAAAATTQIDIMGWAFGGTFAPSGQTGVTWTAGSIALKDGTTYSISSGSVGSISTSAPTYIYFDKDVSLTVLQTTTNPVTAVGPNKIMVAVAQGNPNSGKNAVVTAFGGTGSTAFLGTNDIAAGSITSALIAAGTILASNIAAGTITGDRIASNTINTNQLIAGTITGFTITGSTITGTTLTTANSGQRVVLTSTLAQFYDSSGNLTVQTFGSSSPSSSFIIKGQQSVSSIYLDTGSAGTIAFLSNGSVKVVVDTPNNRMYPQVSGFDLGVAGANWRDIYHNGVHVNQGIDMPIHYWVQVQSGIIWEGNDPGWSISHPSTGRYTITHSLGHTRYAAVATAIRGSGAGAYSAKIESFSSSSVTVTVFNDAGTASDSDFMLTIMEDPN